MSPAEDKGAVPSSMFRSLRQLDLRDNILNAVGIRVLVSSPYLEEIENLLVTGERLTAAMHTLLRDRFGDKVDL